MLIQAPLACCAFSIFYSLIGKNFKGWSWRLLIFFILIIFLLLLKIISNKWRFCWIGFFCAYSFSKPISNWRKLIIRFRNIFPNSILTFWSVIVTIYKWTRWSNHPCWRGLLNGNESVNLLVILWLISPFSISSYIWPEIS